MSLADYQTLVESLVRDTDGLIGEEERDRAIDLARLRYSQDRPRSTVQDVVSPGGRLLGLPTAFETGFGSISRIEIPAGVFPPRYIRDDAWEFYRDLDGLKVMLEKSLAEGDQARFHFTITHTLDDTADSIPEKHREPVASWAAALLLEQLATLHSGSELPTIDSDSVDHQSKSRDYAARAKQKRQRYFDELGIDPKRNVAAGVVVNLDPVTTHGRGRMFPGKGRR